MYRESRWEIHELRCGGSTDAPAHCSKGFALKCCTSVGNWVHANVLKESVRPAAQRRFREDNVHPTDARTRRLGGGTRRPETPATKVAYQVYNIHCGVCDVPRPRGINRCGGCQQTGWEVSLGFLGTRASDDRILTNAGLEHCAPPFSLDFRRFTVGRDDKGNAVQTVGETPNTVYDGG